MTGLISLGISLDYIIEYAKKYKLQKPPLFEDFYKAEMSHGKPSSGYSDMMRSAAVATMGGITTYLAVKYI